ncbi:MAG: carboxymuconolactone decarboxylase family protein [Acidimicrobiia bacterium]
MWISTIPYAEAEGELKACYDRQAKALGEPTEMTLVGSLYPPLVSTRLDLYSTTERCPSNLTPHQRNLISFVTSALNGTVYCMSQVSIKLRETGFSNDQIAALADNPTAVDMPPADAELVRYTAKLTSDPKSVTAADIDRLRSHGFDDLDILDANSQCAHLNYVNRVVCGLGIRHVVDPEFPAYLAIPDHAGAEPSHS